MSDYCPSHDWDRYINSFDDSTNCPACGEDDWEDCTTEWELDRYVQGKTQADIQVCAEPKCKNCGYCYACHGAGRLQLCILPELYYHRKCGWCGEEVHPQHRDYVSEYWSGEPIICHPICKNALELRQKETQKYEQEHDIYADNHRYWEEEFIPGRDEDGYYNFEGEPHRT
jgi:hypothetical protein